VKMQSRREGNAGANKRVGISEKVMSGVNWGRTSNLSKTLFQWLMKGNSLKDSSTDGTRTSQVGEELIKSAKAVARGLHDGRERPGRRRRQRP